MQDLGALSLDELTELSMMVARELRVRKSPNRVCAGCAREFVARADALYCSSRCRVAARRQRRSNGRNVGITGIGYEGLTIDAFVSKLRLRGVRTLVDVRLNAISRKKGFSKRALSQALADSGIEYMHMPTLGNQRDNRAGYGELDSAEAREARTRFAGTLESERSISALEELADLARTRDVVVFCYEHDERHCHREQVIEQVTRLLRSDLVDA